MALAQLSSSDFEVAQRPSIFNLAKVPVRNSWVLLVAQNPILWSLTEKNPQADLEGPFYLPGSPGRSIEGNPGDAVVASEELIKESGAFLYTGQVCGDDGTPIPNATLDLWQANPAGEYYFLSYNLRGKVQTDAEGCFEILTVLPAGYGPTAVQRAGHIHLIITPGEKERSLWLPLTTQSYICRDNNPKGMDRDFVNWIRKARHGNMMPVWSCDQWGDSAFPPLEDQDLNLKVKKWNEKLKILFEDEGEARIKACAHVQYKLTKRGG